jgi:hypothetical protein
MIWKAFFREMEKMANQVGAALNVGLNAWMMQSSIDENTKKMKINPLENEQQAPLPSIEQSSFDGAKRMPTTSTVLPHTTRYI